MISLLCVFFWERERDGFEIMEWELDLLVRRRETKTKIWQHVCLLSNWFGGHGCILPWSIISLLTYDTPHKFIHQNKASVLLDGSQNQQQKCDGSGVLQFLLIQCSGSLIWKPTFSLCEFKCCLESCDKKWPLFELMNTCELPCLFRSRSTRFLAMLQSMLVQWHPNGPKFQGNNGELSETTEIFQGSFVEGWNLMQL